MTRFHPVLVAILVSGLAPEDVSIQELPEPPGYVSPLVVEDHALDRFFPPDRAAVERFAGCYEVLLPEAVPYPYWATSVPDLLRFELLPLEAEQREGWWTLHAMESNLLGGWAPEWWIERDSMAVASWGNGYEGLSVTLEQPAGGRVRGTIELWSCTGTEGPFELAYLAPIPCPIACPRPEELRPACVKRPKVRDRKQ